MASQLLLLDLICFCMSFRWLLLFKEPAGIAYYAFEAFTRGYILVELEMISFRPMIVVLL